VSNSIITDNGSQFTGRKFLEFCDKNQSAWTGHPSRIHRPMVRWSVPKA
jgi:hypothetical protein